MALYFGYVWKPYFNPLFAPPISKQTSVDQKFRFWKTAKMWENAFKKEWNCRGESDLFHVLLLKWVSTWRGTNETQSGVHHVSSRRWSSWCRKKSTIVSVFGAKATGYPGLESRKKANLQTFSTAFKRNLRIRITTTTASTVLDEASWGRRPFDFLPSEGVLRKLMRGT